MSLYLKHESRSGTEYVVGGLRLEIFGGRVELILSGWEKRNDAPLASPDKKRV